jgi:hypothetical protein
MLGLAVLIEETSGGKYSNFMNMKQKKVLKGAKDFGVKITVNKDLDKYKNLFPEKLELANKILSNMKFIHIKIK